MKSDCRYLFPESWNLWKVTSVGSDFLSPASLDINSPFFKYILPMTPKMHKKNILFYQAFDVKTGCQKLRFFILFNCKKWQVLIKCLTCHGFFIHFSGYKYKIKLVSILRKRKDHTLISISSSGSSLNCCKQCLGSGWSATFWLPGCGSAKYVDPRIRV